MTGFRAPEIRTEWDVYGYTKRGKTVYMRIQEDYAGNMRQVFKATDGIRPTDGSGGYTDVDGYMKLINDTLL